MAESEAILGIGTKLEVNTTGTTWFEVGEVVSVTPPAGEAEEVDVTHLGSPNRTREFIQGLIDNGQVPLTVNWIPGGTTDAYMRSWQQSGANRPTRLVYPNGVTDTFPAFCKTWAGGEITPEGKMSGSGTLRVAGATVQDDGA